MPNYEQMDLKTAIVLGQVAVVKILDWALKYATLECKYFICFHGQKKIHFKKNVESALNIKLRKSQIFAIKHKF